MRYFLTITGSFLFLSLHLFGQTNKSGWINLFDGKTLDGWKLMTGKAEYKPEGGAIVEQRWRTHPIHFLYMIRDLPGISSWSWKQ